MNKKLALFLLASLMLASCSKKEPKEITAKTDQTESVETNTNSEDSGKDKINYFDKDNNVVHFRTVNFKIKDSKIMKKQYTNQKLIKIDYEFENVNADDPVSAQDLVFDQQIEAYQENDQTQIPLDYYQSSDLKNSESGEIKVKKGSKIEGSLYFALKNSEDYVTLKFTGSTGEIGTLKINLK